MLPGICQPHGRGILHHLTTLAVDFRVGVEDKLLGFP